MIWLIRADYQIYGLPPTKIVLKRLVFAGKCHVESGNYPSALEALNSAIRINPAYAEVNSYLILRFPLLFIESFDCYFEII